MSWKVVGLVESRSGDLEFLPEWTIGSPNNFGAHSEATMVRDAMQSHVERNKAERTAASPGVGGAGPAIRYMVLPAIDDGLIAQLHGGSAPHPSSPPTPQLTFNT